jgi:hypothetical protein
LGIFDTFFSKKQVPIPKSKFLSLHVAAILEKVGVWAGESAEIKELLEGLKHIDRYEISKQRRKQ